MKNLIILLLLSAANVKAQTLISLQTVAKQTNSMKLFLNILLLLFCSNLFATNYYVSSTGSDAANGLTPATAWQTLSKVNSFTFAANDSILFKRGDSFYGTIKPTASSITFDAYGTGANPIITGLTSISSWSNLGGNIWEATIPGSLAKLNTVIINNQLTAMGRWPNTGYITYTNFVNNTSITNGSLFGTGYSSGEILIRRQAYAADRATITGLTDSTITFTSASAVEMRPNFGFFIQNNAATLDQQNEWFYYDNAGTKKLKVYSTTNPGTIQVATLDTLINLGSTSTRNNLTFSNIDFIGSNGNIAKVQYANFLTFSNCKFQYAGISGIEYGLSESITTTNCVFSDINMVGEYEVHKYAVDNRRFLNNTYKRIGLNIGMALPINSTYTDGNASTGVIFGSRNVTVQYCVFDSIGYNGITIRPGKANTLIKNNLFSWYTMVKNDGGAIYSAAIQSIVNDTNVVIEENIIRNNGNAAAGADKNYPHSLGIYLDASSNNITVRNNTVFNAAQGIYFSHAQYCTITGNTLYGGGYNTTAGGNEWTGIMSATEAFTGYRTNRNNTVKGNIVVALASTDVLFNVYNTYNSIDSMGVIDSNYYYNPGTISAKLFQKSGSVNGQMTWAQWRAQHPIYDANSTYSTATPQFYYNNTNATTTINFSGLSKKDVYGNVYNQSCNIAPYRSVLLLDNGTYTPPPAVQSGAIKLRMIFKQ